MALNFTALAHCDRVVSDDELVSQAFADALGVDLDVMNAQIDAVAQVVDGEPAFLNLADEDFFVLRQRVMFELACLGRAVRAPRVREIIRACQVWGFSGVADLAKNYPSPADLATITWANVPSGAAGNQYRGREILSGPERTAIVAFAVALKEQRVELARVTARAAEERPTRCINFDTARAAHGYSHFDPETLPAPSDIDRFLVASEKKGRLLPWMDIRLAPWFNEVWSKKGPGDVDNEERILTLVGEEFAASGLTNSSADGILGAAALKRAASVKDSKLSMNLYLASLNRLLISAAFCNSFGPGGSRVVSAYNQVLLTIAARNSCGLAQGYDRALRLRLSSHNLEIEALVTARRTRRELLLLVTRSGALSSRRG